MVRVLSPARCAEEVLTVRIQGYSWESPKKAWSRGGRGGSEKGALALWVPRRGLSSPAAFGPNPLTMMEKTKATMLMGYAGQKQEKMLSHR